MQDALQQLPMLVNSFCAADVAFVAQAFWQVESVHASMHVMIALHAGSFTHVWVTAQQLELTQLAHDAVLKETPQAVVPPVDPLELPLPPPLPPPLDEPLVLLHALTQFALPHVVRSCPALWHALDAEQFDMLEPAGHTQASTLEGQLEVTALV